MCLQRLLIYFVKERIRSRLQKSPLCAKHGTPPSVKSADMWSHLIIVLLLWYKSDKLPQNKQQNETVCLELDKMCLQKAALLLCFKEQRCGAFC